MPTSTHRITADELLRMPQSDARFELIEGELIIHEPAGHQHGRIAVAVTVSLDTYVAAHNLGAVYAAETGFVIATNPDTVRAPDAAFVCRERAE